MFSTQRKNLKWGTKCLVILFRVFYSLNEFQSTGFTTSTGTWVQKTEKQVTRRSEGTTQITRTFYSSNTSQNLECRGTGHSRGYAVIVNETKQVKFSRQYIRTVLKFIIQFESKIFVRKCFGLQKSYRSYVILLG